MIIWIILALGVLAILVGLLAFYKFKGEKRETDYKTFFILGIIFTGFGASQLAIQGTGAIGILGLGLVYMAVGLANKDKWNEPMKVSANREKFMKILVLGTVVLVGLTALLVFLAP
jgi:uncharacterized membrane protein YidH (DUF202 family)